MALHTLQEALKPIQKNQSSYVFNDLIRDCRKTIGLKQFMAAQLAGMTERRLKHLEMGWFIHMPKAHEIYLLSRLYDLDPTTLQVQAEEYIHERKSKKD